MMSTLSLLALCGSVLLVQAQLNCPDISDVCDSNPCAEGARCPRFFNSECRVNTCDGVCSPNFFFRGRNVTTRCETLRTCASRSCPPRRQCVDEVVESCNRRGRCRQRLEGRCVLPPTTQQPNTVSTSAPFTPPLPTNSTATTGSPFTANPSPTTPTNSSLCFPQDCSSMGLQCVPFPFTADGQTFVTGICLPPIGLVCEDIDCPDNQECALMSFIERNLTFAQCAVSNNDTQMTSSCATIQCPEGTVCIDLRFGDTQVAGQCLLTNCASNTNCNPQSADVCVSVPDDFRFDDVSSLCIPGSVQSQFGTETCEQSGRVCPSPTVCQEAFLDDILLGTFCDVSQFPMDCSRVNCGEEEECVITSFDFGSSANCVPRFNFQFTLRILEALGLVEGISTVAPITTPLPTNSTPVTTPTTGNPFTANPSPTTPTNSSLCFPQDCSSMGLQCVPFPIPGPNDEIRVIGICLPLIGLICEDIDCADNQECALQSFVERNVTYSQCIASSNFAQLMPSCATIQCPEGTVCIDLRLGDMQVTGQCLVTNCVNNNICNNQLGEVCASVPDGSRFGNINSLCIPDFVQTQFGNETCEQSGRVCPSPLVCQEAFLDNIIAGTLCNVNQLTTDCSQVNCSEDEECITNTLVSSSQTVATCISNGTFALILPVLEALGVVETSTTPTSTTPTELFTTLSNTLAPPTTLTNISCPFTCSFGLTCEILNGFPTCVQPTTCTDDFSTLCMQSGSICQESNGTARCVPPSSCEELATVSPCPNGTQCIVIPPFTFPGLNDITASCFPLVGRSCEEISCSEGEVCIVTDVVTRNLTGAQCISSQNAIFLIPQTCDTLQCDEGNVCVDLQVNGFPVAGNCLETNCANSNDTVCDGNSMCFEVPPEFEIPAESLCIPFSVTPQFGTQTCAENGRVCEFFETCNEAFIGGNIVGTACSQFGNILTSTCQDSICGEGEECLLQTVEGFGTVQNCLSTEAVDTSAMFFEFIFSNI